MSPVFRYLRLPKMLIPCIEIEALALLLVGIAFKPLLPLWCRPVGVDTFWSLYLCSTPAGSAATLAATLSSVVIWRLLVALANLFLCHDQLFVSMMLLVLLAM